MMQSLLVGLAAFVILLQCVILWLQVKSSNRSNRRDSVLIHKAMDAEKRLVTLAQVVKIFEDETNILKKRNEQAAVRDRFRNAR
jgi:hypothetical protein